MVKFLKSNVVEKLMKNDILMSD